MDESSLSLFSGIFDTFFGGFDSLVQREVAIALFLENGAGQKVVLSRNVQKDFFGTLYKSVSSIV
jgi:hypothetical protein